jgi:hypothetical protein
LDDPERYLIAFFDAHVVAFNMKERKAARILAAMTVGNVVYVPKEIAERGPAGFVPLAWGPSRPKDYGPILNTRTGTKAASIDGRADAIRKKSRLSKGIDEQSDRWLFNMTAALSLPLRGTASGIDAQKAKELVWVLALEVGELEFAQRTIFPMIDLAAGNATLAPDFSLIYGPATA